MGDKAADDYELTVAQSYDAPDLLPRILKAAADAGLDPDRLTPQDLAPIDEFHVGGRAATKHLIAKMGLAGTEHVLDIGCGIGGAARTLAASTGCRVTGIDLTPSYVDAARDLTLRTGLSDRVAFQAASALAMPFPDAAFDAAITIHVAMNIKDRAGLYREAARVLKPGAALGIYDVMAGPAGELRYPVPWADTAASSHLTTPEEMHTLLAAAGFRVDETEDRTAFGIDFFRRRLSATAPSGPLGLQVLLGKAARPKFANLLANLENGAAAPTVIIAHRT